MADTTISPNMNLPVPIASTTPGPAWAVDIVACMNAIDSHGHVTGQGVPITPDGININASLPMGKNYLTNTGAVNLFFQAAPLSSSLLGYLYGSGQDLYFNDGAGNQIRITQSGSVAGSTGTITGLPSGTASASFSAGTFTFQSATNTPATMNIGPIVTGAASASPKTVTLSASGSQPANYAMTWPLALPASTSFVNLDTSGNMGTVTSTGSGSVVLDSSPSIASPTFSGSVAGTVSGILSSGTYSPTVTNGAFGSAAAAVSGTFSYMRINTRVIVYGQVSGTSDSSGRFEALITTPFPPTANFSGATKAQGVLNEGNGTNTPTFCAVTARAGSKTVSSVFFGTATSASVNLILNFSYDCA